MAEKRRTGTKGRKPKQDWDPKTQDWMERIGINIRALQDKKGWSNKELGSKLSLSDAAISRIENAAQNWPISYLPRIAEVFGVEVSELIPQAESAPVSAPAATTSAVRDPEPPFT